MKVIFGIVYLLCVLALIASCIYGAVLAFSASIIIGVVGLFVPPLFTIGGIIGIFGHPEIFNLAAKLLSLPF